jgi:hypothetical protein
VEEKGFIHSRETSKRKAQEAVFHERQWESGFLPLAGNADFLCENEAGSSGQIFFYDQFAEEKAAANLKDLIRQVEPVWRI